MKAAEMLAEHEALEAKIDAAHEAHVTPFSTRKYELQNEGVRVWKLDTECELRFALFEMPYGGGFSLQSGGQGIYRPKLTAPAMRLAAEAIEHALAWATGAIDDLAPSGEWKPVVPGWSYIANPHAKPLHTFSIERIPSGQWRVTCHTCNRNLGEVGDDETAELIARTHSQRGSR